MGTSSDWVPLIIINNKQVRFCVIRFYKSLPVLFCLFIMGCQHSKNKLSENSLSQEPPKLLKPVIKKIWIPEIIKNGGTEWEEGHYLYRIQRDSTWSR